MKNELELDNNIFSTISFDSQYLKILINSLDEITKTHSLNVSEYAVLIGKELQLPQRELEIIKIGGLLHDVGKISIPENILKKMGRLTIDEYQIIKNHSKVGEVILENHIDEEVLKIVRSHHERLDGKGYPDKLTWDEIPFLAQIVSIADSFDAMTSWRPYNQIKTLAEALIELYECSKCKSDDTGLIKQQFNPNLVNVFIVAVKKNLRLLEKFQEKDNQIIHDRNIKIYSKKI